MFEHRFKNILVILIILVLIVELCVSQTSKPKRKKPNRNRNRKKGQEVEQRVKCLSCYVDFRASKFSATDPCYNPYHNESFADRLFLTRCPVSSKGCVVDLYRMNGVLEKIDRRCGAPSGCKPFNISRTYGIMQTQYTYCCSGKVTEDDDEYDPDEHDNYRCPDGQH